jgi:Tol biopolymer transport system component
MSVSTGKTVNITHNRAIDNFPAWTPEGNIGFVSNRDGGFDIYVVDPPAEVRANRESDQASSEYPK